MIEYRPFRSLHRGTDRTSVLDFRPGAQHSVTPDGLPGDATVYSVAPDDRCALFVKVGAIERLREAPFFYLEQAAEAARVFRLDESELAAIAWHPPRATVPIFSIGRCGSTLLHRYLGVLGLASVSEPDAFTNIADALTNLDDTDRRELYLSVALDTLRRTHPRASTVAVKMRGRAAPLMSVWPGGLDKAVFLYRDPKAWSHSVHLTFREGPKNAARLLAGMFSALGAALAAGRSPLLIRYEDMADDPRGVLREFSRVVGEAEPDAAAVDAILARDSQAGTPVARDLRSNRSVPADFDEAFRTTFRRQARLRGLSDVLEQLEIDF